MLIVWGTKESRKRKGYAADYCTVCRCARAMSVTELRSVRHLYWIPLGDGKPLGYESTCCECKTLLVRPLDSYLRFQHQAVWNDEFINATNPLLLEGIEERRELEDRVYEEQASPEERTDLIWEVIQSLDYIAEKRAKRSSSESITAVIGLLFVAAVLGAVLCSSGQFNCRLKWMWYTAASSILCLLVYRATVSSKRALEKSVQNELVEALVPLDPTLDELVKVRRLGKKSPLAKAIRPEKLLRRVEQRIASA